MPECPIPTLLNTCVELKMGLNIRSYETPPDFFTCLTTAVPPSIQQFFSVYSSSTGGHLSPVTELMVMQWDNGKSIISMNKDEHCMLYIRIV